MNHTDTDFGISISTGNMTSEERTELWQVRMRELSGAIAVSALVQVFIGVFGEWNSHTLWELPIPLWVLFFLESYTYIDMCDYLLQ